MKLINQKTLVSHVSSDAFVASKSLTSYNPLMQLQELNLKNFRNYSKRTFIFSQNTTVFVGPNAIGKTNILEAIFLLAIGKSFRAEREGEMVRIGEEVGRVKCICHPDQSADWRSVEGSFSPNSRVIDSSPPEADRNDNINDLEVIVTGGFVQGVKTPIKKFLVNGVPRRIVDFAGQLKAVLFHPEDLDLVRGSPSGRRRYLDFVLTQTDREYRRSLSAYERAVRQRNRLLERIRDGFANRQQLYFWDQVLIRDGGYLQKKREELITAINVSDKPFGEFRLLYDHSYISETRLTQYAEEEVAAGVTLVGPHRDDVQFFDDKRSLAAYGSRGEQRLLVLWLKLCELRYIKEITGERPLLLLDDIFSELDHPHREEVLKLINLQQTIITSADRHFVPEQYLKDTEMIELT